jgi:hypothetical protein
MAVVILNPIFRTPKIRIEELKQKLLIFLRKTPVDSKSSAKYKNKFILCRSFYKTDQ